MNSESDAAPLRVLVVDDNITNRMIAMQLLQQKHGINPVSADNGREAIETLRQQIFDLVLMDCMMPEMDGYQATRAIREGQTGQRNREIPIIALTANTLSGDREHCIAAGMSDYLPKPIRPKELAQILARWGRNSHSTNSESGKMDTASREKASPPSTYAASELFDISHMEDMYEGDQAVIDSLLSYFLDNLDECMIELHNAIEEGSDTERVRFHTHQIRGSAGNYGAKSLQEIMTRMEKHCMNGQLENALKLFPEASEIAHKTIDAIEAVRDPINR